MTSQSGFAHEGRDKPVLRAWERPIRVVLDSNAVDDLLSAETYDVLQAAVAEGALDVMWTHITVDELAAIPDLDRRAHLLCLAVGLARMVPTGAFVVDYSRLNFARLSDDEEAFEALRKGNLRHTRDALIAATAALESAAVVTNDEQLRKRCRARHVRTITVPDLVIDLAARSSSACRQDAHGGAVSPMHTRPRDG